MKNRTTASLLLAGLLAAGGAFAQNSATPTTDSATGEMSTMTEGRPNAVTTNNPTVENPATAPGVSGGPAVQAVPAPSAVVVVPQDSVVVLPADTAMGAAPASTVVLPVAPGAPVDRSATGEASTYVGGQFNANPDDPRLRR